MKFWGLFITILFFSLSILAAQDPGTAVGVQPSSEIRYPNPNDIINPANLKKAATAAISVLPTQQKLLSGWYLQIVLKGAETEVVDQAVRLSPAFQPQGLALRPRNGEWRLLIGPLENNQLQPMLKTAENLGLKDFILRRE